MQGRGTLLALLLFLFGAIAASGCGPRVDPERQRAAAEAVFAAGGVLRIDESDLPMKSIEALPEDGFTITSVDLNQTDATDEAVKALEGMKSLTYVGLHSTRITDAGIEYLASLTELTEIELSNTAISDVGLQLLAGLPELTKIYLNDTSLSDEAIEEFKKKCPDCTVIR